MNELKLSYLSGLIDGEGYVGIITNTKRKTYSPRLAVNMCDRRPLDLLSDMFTNPVREKPSRFPNSRDQYLWSVDGRSCLKPLSILLPYLLLKKEQAEIILSVNWYAQCGRGKKLPDDIAQEREKAYHDCRKLNKRGS